MTSAIGWIPLFGEFETKDSEILFRGKRVPGAEQPAGAPPSGDRAGLGLILTNQTIADGRISAEVEFKQVTTETLCEIAVSYDSNGTHLVTGGLGGVAWAMFGIREFGGPKSPGAWVDHRVSGERVNLKPETWYRIEVSLRGASVSLHIDGVAVGTAEVTSPMGVHVRSGSSVEMIAESTSGSSKSKEPSPRRSW